MSYLLMQILVCLLIAGLIGLIIGWLLRGGCTGVLSDNDTSWEAKLDESDTAWNSKVQGLIKENDDTIYGVNQTLLSVKNSLMASESKLESTTAQAKQVEIDWATKLESTIEEHTGIESNLSQELLSVKTKLTSAQSDSKGMEEKLKSTEASAKKSKLDLDAKLESANSKLEKTIKEHSGIESNLSQELLSVKTKLTSAQSNSKGMEDKLKSTEANAKQSKLDLDAKLESANSQVQGLMSQNDSEVTSLGAELLTIKSALSVAEEKNKTVETQLKSAQSAVDTAKAETEKIQSEKTTKEDNEHQLLNSIYEWKQKYKVIESKLDSIENAKVEAKAEVERVESEKKEAMLRAKPVLLSAARAGGKDNLTLIKGIGKVLEERLNKLGVYHFDQIASWSDDQEAWMDERMSFPGRVEREEWVKQAKALASGTETKFSQRVKDGDVPTSKKR